MKHQDVILVGAGGHALSLCEFAGDKISGYLAFDKNESMPVERLGDDSCMARFIKDGKAFHIAFVYSGLPLMWKRGKIIESYKQSGAQFASLISPNAIVTPNSVVGEGTAIFNGAIVNRACLGNHVIVNSGAIVEHDCVIGDNTFIGPGAVVGGFTKIGSNCFIGLGARIGNGLEIADNVSVAMGAVVNKNLTEPGIYHGQPLKLFKLPEKFRPHD